jgi:histidinol phosphatase-like PHP family hydrolase
MTDTADYHVHLRRSPCTADEMTAVATLKEAAAVGLAEVGLVNHLHPVTDLEIFRLGREELEAADGLRPSKVLYGAEIDLLDQKGATSYRPEVREHVDFVTLAPGHQQLQWVQSDLTLPPGEFLIRETQSIIEALGTGRFDILVHPYIYVAFPKLAPHYVGTLRPGDLSASLVDRLADVLIENGTFVEYHCRDIVVRPERLGGDPFVKSYMTLLEALRSRGVRFVTGSDAHRLDQIPRSRAAPAWARNRLEVGETRKAK